MKLQKVILTNFFRMGEAVEIPLDISGLVLISADNQDAPLADSNGGGKSTCIAGVTYALWGKCPNGLQADEVVNREVGKDCRVSLFLLDDDGSQIEVTRTRKDSKSAKSDDLILLVNGVNLQGSTNEATQEKIDNLIGMDFVTFCALMPGLGTPVANLTDKEVKSLLERILRTEELSVAHKLAQAKHKQLEKEIAVDRATLFGAKDAQNSARLRLTQYARSRDEFEQKKTADLKVLTAELKVAAKQMSDAKATWEVTKASHTNAAATDMLVLTNALWQADNAWKEIRAKYDKVSNAYTQQVASIRAKMEVQDELISKFAALDVCPTCQLEVDSEHKSHLQHESFVRKNELLSKLDALTAKFKKLCKVYATKETAAQSARETAQEAVSAANEAKALVKERDREVILLENLYKEKRKSAKSLVDRKDSLKLEENKFSELCAAEENTISEKDIEIKDLTATIQAKLEQESIYKFWVDSFSPSGIRSHMMENVTPFLNERAQYYCDALTGGELEVVFNTKTTQKSGKVVEKFNIEVSQKHGAGLFKGSSTGEKARANLVVSFVLGDLAALRTSKKLEFRCIDEALDAIDKAGDGAVVELLRSMEESFGTVYVITHKETLKDKFPKELIIMKKNGFSSLKGVFDRDVH